jgi:hypothetical protein
MRSNQKVRYLLAAALVAAAATSLAAVLARTGSPTKAHPAATTRGTASLPPVGKSSTVLAARFAILSDRHSNACALRPQSVDSLAVDGRLQGSCCTPMVLAHYAKQVRSLAGYRAVAQVPRDPYDIPVAQAKQLLTYHREITLTVAQQAVYRKAMRLAHEHGPCCCHCWRWSAFEGQARYLISRRSYHARQIATIWDLEDGCGG